MSRLNYVIFEHYILSGASVFIENKLCCENKVGCYIAYLNDKECTMLQTVFYYKILWRRFIVPSNAERWSFLNIFYYNAFSTRESNSDIVFNKDAVGF